jgi:hypothetical protein
MVLTVESAALVSTAAAEAAEAEAEADAAAGAMSGGCGIPPAASSSALRLWRTADAAAASPDPLSGETSKEGDLSAGLCA